MKKISLLVVISVLMTLPYAHAQRSSGPAEENVPEKREESSAPKPLTSINLTYYFDSRSFNTLNILTSSKSLPLGFNLWGFTDIHGAHNEPGNRFDLTRYFMEYRLRRTLNPEWVLGLNGLGLEMEYNDFNGSGNGMLRFGITFNHGLPVFKGSWLQWRFAPIETDQTGMMAGIVYFLPVSKHISLLGFADLNINDKASNRWVAETEMSIRVKDRLAIAIEGRYNGYENAAAGIDGFGVAMGLKFKSQ